MLKKIAILGLSAVVLSACNGAGDDVETPAEEDLAMVESVSLNVMESFPVQVSAVVEGNLRNGCERVDEKLVERDGNVFKVYLTVREEGEVCTQALVPFEETVSLDVVGLEAGAYEVVVNNDANAGFELEVDNVVGE